MGYLPEIEALQNRLLLQKQTLINLEHRLVELTDSTIDKQMADKLMSDKNLVEERVASLKNQITQKKQDIGALGVTLDEENDVTKKSYIFAGNNRIANSLADELVYSHQNHLFSSNLETEEDGSVRSALTYDEFGLEKNNSGDRVSDYTYTDQKRDMETGLMYYNARYYDPNLKRFTSVDPAVINPTDRETSRPSRLNEYGYVLNNPLIYVDPTGESERSFKSFVRRLNGSPSYVRNYVYTEAQSYGDSAVKAGAIVYPVAGAAALTATACPTCAALGTLNVQTMMMQEASGESEYSVAQYYGGYATGALLAKTPGKTPTQIGVSGTILTGVDQKVKGGDVNVGTALEAGVINAGAARLDLPEPLSVAIEETIRQILELLRN